MRMKIIRTIPAFIISILLASCNFKNVSIFESNSLSTNIYEDNGAPKGNFNPDKLLVKDSSRKIERFIHENIKNVTAITASDSWYEVNLKNPNETKNTLIDLRNTNSFEYVDYDYIYETSTEIDSFDISTNPEAKRNERVYENSGLKKGWYKMQKEGKLPGGSSDVIIAVIDTGVDYNHIDLRQNIWVNSLEIPDNGIDDDNNGYVDDVYGWNCVGDNNDPMDDNGHGTHVAGIIGAQNNEIGSVGVAFDCKIMAIKAGNSSGYFINSDITEAIYYAYRNGASVINMSFGGGAMSFAIEEALQIAYSRCVLVASAGNNSKCNELECEDHMGQPSYPACLEYVIGVMSCNADGTLVSAFSNYDHSPYQYNNFEYDIYACGEQIYSTFPNSKYTTMTGTSMAAPVVSGIAGVLRAYYSDREQFSTKYICSQIVNTCELFPFNKSIDEQDIHHGVANLMNAMCNTPKPYIQNVQNYFFMDSANLSANNNDDGIINAGETIKLGIELKNRGGVAKNVDVHINAFRDSAQTISDQYINFEKDNANIGSIGTYSIKGNNPIYNESGTMIDIEDGFIIKVSPNCPNNYRCTINIQVFYKNGLDETDQTIYSSDLFKIDLCVSNGVRIDGLIEEDITFTNAQKYIIDNHVIIPEGVTVTFEEGCEITFYSHSKEYISTIYNSPVIDVYGNLIFNGSESNMITLDVDPYFLGYTYTIHSYADRPNSYTLTPSNTHVVFNYTNVNNALIKSHAINSVYYVNDFAVLFNHSTLQFTCESYFFIYSNGVSSTLSSPNINIGIVNDSLIDLRCESINVDIFAIKNSLILNKSSRICLGIGPMMIIGNESREFYPYYAEDNIFMSTNNVLDANSRSGNVSAISDVLFENNFFTSDFNVESPKQLVTIDTYYWLSDNIDLNNPNISENLVSNNNYLDSNYLKYQNILIQNNITYDGRKRITFKQFEESATFSWPIINSIKLYSGNNEEVTKVGKETIKVRVKFSADMDVSQPFELFYGSSAPYNDYQIFGSFIDSKTWEGQFIVNSLIESGVQRFYSNGGISAGDSIKKLHNNASKFLFDIDLTEALAMSMFAEESSDGVKLSWIQDDYETLMGYNIYRSTDKDGNFVKINRSVIPSYENTFIDDNAEPGVLYWYTFTVVLSDLTESKPSGKISFALADSIKPTIYHTPVNQGYLNNNLVISCVASDNVGIKNVYLFYKNTTETIWKKVSMSKMSDTYTGVINGSELSIEGLQYFIVASDGVNTINKGNEESPYYVVIKESYILNNIGDVDGNGSITTKDAMMIMLAINDDIILSDDEFKRADLNKNKILESVEALRILQYINGKVTSLEF